MALGGFAYVPSSDYPLDALGVVVECYSNLAMRCLVVNKPYTTPEWIVQADFGGTWYTNGGYITNAAGWKLTAGTVAGGVYSASGSAVEMQAPDTGNLVQWSIGAGRAASGPLTPPVIQCTTNAGTNWDFVATYLPPIVSGTTTSPAAHYRAQTYRMLMNTFVDGYGYDTLSVTVLQARAVSPLGLRQACQNIKGTIAGIVEYYVDNRGADTNEDMSVYMANELLTQVPMWTTNALLAQIGVGSDWYDNTPSVALASETNGLLFLLDAITNLMWTTNYMVWGGPDTNEYYLQGEYYEATNWSSLTNLAANPANVTAVGTNMYTLPSPGEWTSGYWITDTEPTNATMYTRGGGYTYRMAYPFTTNLATTAVVHGVDFYMLPDAPYYTISGPPDYSTGGDQTYVTNEYWNRCYAGADVTNLYVWGNRVGPQPIPTNDVPYWCIEPSVNTNVTAAGWQASGWFSIIKWRFN